MRKEASGLAGEGEREAGSGEWQAVLAWSHAGWGSGLVGAMPGGWVWQAGVMGSRERRSLGTVVLVVVDVDRSCDATDYERDPSSNQIESRGKQSLTSGRWGWKNRSHHWGLCHPTLCPLYISPRLLIGVSLLPLFCLGIFFVLCQGCKAPTKQAWETGLALAETVLKDKSQNCSQRSG